MRSTPKWLHSASFEPLAQCLMARSASDGSFRSRGLALSENYVNPGSLRSAHFATYAERQESGLTQVADSEFEDAGDADGEYEDAGMDDQPASGRLHDFCYVS
jgi:hypothetical protein